MSVSLVAVSSLVSGCKPAVSPVEEPEEETATVEELIQEETPSVDEKQEEVTPKTEESKIEFNDSMIKNRLTFTEHVVPLEPWIVPKAPVPLWYVQEWGNSYENMVSGV